MPSGFLSVTILLARFRKVTKKGEPGSHGPGKRWADGKRAGHFTANYRAYKSLNLHNNAHGGKNDCALCASL